MYEVEVKVAADHDAVRERLPATAEALGTVEQVDTYFDAPHRNFVETDEALRLRRERRIDDLAGPSDEAGSPDDEWTTEITYKGPLVDAESKTREEFESVVADGDAIEEALERLGFEPAADVRKERERYRIDEFTVTLDAVDGLGEFVEVETEVEEVEKNGEGDRRDGADDASESRAIEQPRDAARSVLEALGCDPDEQIRTSYLGLLLADDA